jgi:hypothetical protein
MHPERQHHSSEPENTPQILADNVEKARKGILNELAIARVNALATPAKYQAALPAGLVGGTAEAMKASIEAHLKRQGQADVRNALIAAVARVARRMPEEDLGASNRAEMEKTTVRIAEVMQGLAQAILQGSDAEIRQWGLHEPDSLEQLMNEALNTAKPGRDYSLFARRAREKLFGSKPTQAPAKMPSMKPSPLPVRDEQEFVEEEIDPDLITRYVSKPRKPKPSASADGDNTEVGK